MLGIAGADRPRYMPVLKARQGERKALEAMTEPDSSILPVLEVVEVDFAGLATEELHSELLKLAGRLGKAWPSGRPRIVIDTADIELESTPDFDLHGELMADPRLITAPLLELLRANGMRAVPVIRLTDTDAYIESLQGLVQDGREPGACLRIGGEDLDDQLIPLDRAVERLLYRYDLGPERVDLLLDFGALADDNTLGMASPLARFVIPTLDREPWRSFALGAGAFPVNLAEVSAYSIAELPRRDRRFWLQLHGMQFRQPLDYSDYGVAHPLLQTGVAFAAPPQVRYTAGDAWLVLKGRRTDRRGHKQFFDLCGRLLAERGADVSPANWSWGDEQIHRAASNAGRDNTDMGPGNASTWRSIATSHHIGHVLHGLRTRGAP